MLMMADDRDLLQQYGVRIRFIGRRDMLPQDVLEAVDRMEDMTAGNTKYVSYLQWRIGSEEG